MVHPPPQMKNASRGKVELPWISGAAHRQKLRSGARDAAWALTILYVRVRCKLWSRLEVDKNDSSIRTNGA